MHHCDRNVVHDGQRRAVLEGVTAASTGCFSKRRRGWDSGMEAAITLVKVHQPKVQQRKVGLDRGRRESRLARCNEGCLSQLRRGGK